MTTAAKTKKAAPAALRNIHPVDDLAQVRAAIKELEGREAKLKTAIMADPKLREGAEYRAFIQESKRNTVDKEALIAAFGEKFLEPFTRTTEVKSLKLAKKTEE
jgi:hypothetical protein